MVEITERQELIYDEIIDYKQENDGCSPSLLTIRQLLITKRGVTLSDQTINEEIQRMTPDLLGRNLYKNLVVVGGQWKLANPQEIEVVDD